MNNDLPVEEYLWLRDVAGMSQIIKPGDWYYYTGVSGVVSPVPILSTVATTTYKDAIRIPTTDDLLSFVREKAEEKWDLFSDLITSVNNAGKHTARIETFIMNAGAKKVVVAEARIAPSLKLALLELLKKIMEVE